MVAAVSSLAGVERDITGVFVDSSLVSMPPNVQLANTLGQDETGVASAPLPSLLVALVFASAPVAGGTPTLQSLVVDSATGIPSSAMPDMIEPSLVGDPAIARIGAATIAVFRSTSGSVSSAEITASPA